MLGKLRTRLSDESFRAGLLIRSWDKAGLLPELSEIAQCLKDSDAATMVKTKRMKRHLTDKDPVGTPTRKKARIDTGSPDSNI
jgi:hypothetical protein